MLGAQTLISFNLISFSESLNNLISPDMIALGWSHFKIVTQNSSGQLSASIHQFQFPKHANQLKSTKSD
jgi:hypothetical protein